MAAERCPILVHASLADSDVLRLLSQSKHKIRLVENTVPGTCIFPTCAVTFLILPVRQTTPEWPPVAKSIKLKAVVEQNLDRLVNVHRNSYVLALSPIHSQSERDVLAAIQQRYLDQRLSVLPVHNSQEGVEVMLTIAAGSTPEVILTIAASNTKTKMAEAREAYSDWLKSVTSDEAMLSTLELAGISCHEGQVLQDGLHSIGKVTMATKEQLMDCTLDANRAEHVHNFFDKDEMIM